MTKKCESCLAGFSKEDVLGNCTCGATQTPKESWEERLREYLYASFNLKGEGEQITKDLEEIQQKAKDFVSQVEQESWEKNFERRFKEEVEERRDDLSIMSLKYFISAEIQKAVERGMKEQKEILKPFVYAGRIEDIISQAKAEEREALRKDFEIEKLASNVALMKILVVNGTKGDMERLITEFTERLSHLEANK